MSHNITVEGGKTIKLLTAGKYCDQDIIVTAEGSNTDEAYETGYAAGAKSEYDKFWDAFQMNGTRSTYQYAFCKLGWTAEILRPKYVCKIVGDGAMCMFIQANMDGKWQELLDISAVQFDLTEATVADSMFANAKVTGATLLFSEKMVNLNNAFTKNQQGAVKGMELTMLVPNPKCTYANAFSYHHFRRFNLLPGTIIGVNGFAMTSTLVPHEDIMSIMYALEDKTEDTSGTSWVVTIGATNKAKLTEDELAIAYDKGWTVN